LRNDNKAQKALTFALHVPYLPLAGALNRGAQKGANASKTSQTDVVAAVDVANQEALITFYDAAGYFNTLGRRPRPTQHIGYSATYLTRLTGFTGKRYRMRWYAEKAGFQFFEYEHGRKFTLPRPQYFTVEAHFDPNAQRCMANWSARNGVPTGLNTTSVRTELERVTHALCPPVAAMTVQFEEKDCLVRKNPVARKEFSTTVSPTLVSAASEQGDMFKVAMANGSQEWRERLTRAIREVNDAALAAGDSFKRFEVTPDGTQVAADVSVTERLRG
jgi:hypothetical protein